LNNNSLESKKYALSENENTLFKTLNTASGLMKIMVYGVNNVARYNICEIMKNLSKDNKDFSKMCLEYLFSRFIRVSYSEFAIYLMAIETLVNLKDKFEEERLNLFITNTISITKKEISESYLAYSYITDLFLKIALKSQFVQKYIQFDPLKFEHIEGWLNTHIYPQEGYVFFHAI